MIFECRSYDKEGRLVKVHSVEEIKGRFKGVILPVVDGRNRSLLENFSQCEIEEYPIHYLDDSRRINDEY